MPGSSSDAGNRSNVRYVAISVDDGSKPDLRTAELLHKHGLQATFYVPARNPERPVITPSEVREIATHFEVGSHTLNHSPLRFLSERAAEREIREGKDWLEDVLGRSVVAFCYPRGKFNSRTPTLVKQAGFLGARTCLMCLTDFPRDPFLWGISSLAFRLSRTIQVRHALLEKNLAGLRNFVREYRGETDWRRHFSRSIEIVRSRGGVAHLNMHSWEIDEQSQWTDLESVFREIAQSGLTPVTNGDLFRMWSPSAVQPLAMSEATSQSK
jgi:peptidoglycan/xylan/chitin deacetylase (PgdA/CDA1 family)